MAGTGAGTCTFRSLSWLARSCTPSSADPIDPRPRSHLFSSPLTSLPDDLLIECLARVPFSSLPSLSLVCRRFCLLLDHPSFLLFRRLRGLLRPALLALSTTHLALLSLAASPSDHSCHPLPRLPLPNPRLVPLGRSVYLLSRSTAARLDTWTKSLTPIPPTLLPRRRFAAAAVCGRIYVAGGSTDGAVEEYDPATDAWRVVAEAPRRRYGCMGAGAGGVFYVIGGLRIGDAAAPAHAYASTMDAYDVRTGAWVRTRGIPGGGCAVGACAAGGRVYVLASHAVEVSFWRWEEAGKGGRGREWRRLKPPPVPGQARIAGALRYACVGVGEGTVAVVAHASAAAAGRRVRGGAYDGGWEAGVVLLYDVDGDEWRRGCDLPPAFHDAGLTAVEC